MADINPLIPLATLIASLVACFASLHAADAASDTAKDVAETNGKFNEKIATMNAEFAEGLAGLKSIFDQELKEHEYRLAYLKELALKRITIYEEFMLVVGQLMTMDPDEGGFIEHPFLSEDKYKRFINRLFGMLQKTIWLNRNTKLKFIDFQEKAENFDDFFREHEYDFSRIRYSPERTALIRHSIELQKHFARDFLYLSDYKHLSEAIGFEDEETGSSLP